MSADTRAGRLVGADEHPEVCETFGTFDLERRVGQGGMAEIWLAKRRGVEGFNKPVALKKILAKRAEQRNYVEMFIDEAKLVSRLHHRNIVQIYELGQVDKTYFIAMEFVDGWDLLKLLKRCSSGRRPLAASMAIHLVTEVLRGLDHAHNATAPDGTPLNIVHFDVSPSNVLLGRNGSVKLTDFGVARAAMKLGEGTASDRFRGKVAYMSPEQLENRGVDRRSDIFSAGIVLYEILTLKRLFRARSDQQTLENVRKADVEPRLHRHPELAAPVKAVLRRALSKDPNDRYETAAEMAEELETYLFDNRIRVTDRQVAELLREVFDREPSSGSRRAATRSSATWRSMTRSASASATNKQAPRDADNGLFDADNAVRVLSQLVAQRATGRLLLSRDSVRKQLFVARGRLIHSTSSIETELLGPLLLEHGAVTGRQLAVATERVQVQREKLGAALVSLGALSYAELHQWLERQVAVRVEEACRWKDGHFSFRPEHLPPPDVPRMDVDLLPILAKSVESSFRTRSLAAYFSRLGNPILSKARNQPYPIERLRLAGRELRAVRLILQEKASVRETLRRQARTEQERNRLLRLLFLLHQTGHLVGQPTR